MKKLLIMMLALPLALIACDDDDDNGPSGNFRAVHLAYDTGSLNVLVNDELVEDDLDFDDSTDFFMAPEENFNIKVSTVSSPQTFIIDTNVDAPLEPTTVFILDRAPALRNVETLVLTNSFETISGAAIVRLVHANVNSFFNVDMYIGQSTSNCTNLSGLDAYAVTYGTAANSGQYLAPLDPGSYDICVTEAGDSASLLAFKTGINLKSGSKQTLSFIEIDFQTGSGMGFHHLSDVDDDDETYESEIQQL